MSMHDCVIVAYGRSGVGKARKGSLAQASPVTYGAEVLKGILDRVSSLDSSDIDDVVLGCALPEAKMGLNAGRNIALRAGLPDKVAGCTVDRFCASGLQAIAIASAQIQVGQADVIVAGGVEHMSSLVPSDAPEFHDPWLTENTDVYMPVGVTAENVAVKHGISRVEMERFAVRSHQRASAAWRAGRFDSQIIEVGGYDPEGNAIRFATDECIRPTTNLEALATLRPAFKEDGLVTAGTSSPRSDGAGFVVMMSSEKAEHLGVHPIARLTGFAMVGVDPAYMGMGPAYAVPKLLVQTGLSLDDIQVIELNEAFASQSIAVIRELGLDEEKTNPNGGALALGHPLGATGAILTCKALSELERINGERAMVTMCVGGGMGAAAVFQRL